MALDFPALPATDQVFTSDGVSWKYDGEKWKVVSADASAGVTTEQAIAFSIALG